MRCQREPWLLVNPKRSRVSARGSALASATVSIANVSIAESPALRTDQSLSTSALISAYAALSVVSSPTWR